jgi:flagella basal body P-ring formation protein FlgA
MLCCSNALWLLLAAMPADSGPAALAGRVRADFASRWHVDSAAVQLQWGQWIAADSSLFATSPYRLTGGSSDGWFALILEPLHASPRAIRVRVGVTRPVLTALRPLSFGQRLADGDVGMAPGIVWGDAQPPVLATTAGWEVRRMLRPGDILTAAALAPPVVISAGDVVTVSWQAGGVQVQRDGVAANSARLGETVRVRAGTTELSAEVTAAGAARLVRHAP